MGTKLFSTFYFDCALLLNLLIEIQKERREKREKKRKEKKGKIQGLSLCSGDI
jgi:hypothetical protein